MSMNFALSPKVAANRILTRRTGRTETSTGRRWWQIVRRWADRRRQRVALARLDDRLLADIGLTRAQAAFEAARPFWR